FSLRVRWRDGSVTSRGRPRRLWADARSERALPADGGAARRETSRRRALAVRAEVGRLPRRSRERRRRARAMESERAAAASLFPGAAKARRSSATAFGARRRDRHRARREARVRRDAESLASRGVAHSQALRRDAGALHRVRHPSLERRADPRAPARRAPQGARALGERLFTLARIEGS